MTTIEERRTEIFGDIPESINFEVGFEPTKVDHKKYVMDTTNGRYIDTVGDTFSCVSHPKFFEGVQYSVLDALKDEDTEGANVSWRSARHGGWAMMDLRLPNVKGRVTTDKHEVDVGQRIIALHGIDGSCSNQVFFGAIDFFCTNGMILGDWSQIRRKNTSGFDYNVFLDDLAASRSDFTTHITQMNEWAKVRLSTPVVDTVLKAMIPSERKQEKMLNLYGAEASVRGPNKWALYSAFTNYASYGDDRNGFKLRDTGKDTEATSMWSREQEVSKWVSDPLFVGLKEAA